MKLTCQLLIHSNNPHVQQAYTGFRMLQRRGLIKLEQRFSGEQVVFPTRAKHLRDARKAHLSVLVNGMTVHYDAHDSCEIDKAFLEASDYYFKRSFSAAHVQHLEGREKIHPLGLYYNVYPDGTDWLGLRRSLAFMDRKSWKRAVRPLDTFNWLGFTPRVSVMESLPRSTPNSEQQAPKVLFMVRTWDPHDDPDRSPEKVAELTQINQMRADCVRVLREAFKERFYGGFMHKNPNEASYVYNGATYESYAQKHYPDALMPDARTAAKSAYIKLLQDYPICVATTGLHGSIGGKLGEYVAFSKAIVSEKLNYEVPGDFSSGRNYLEFDSPETCAAQVRRLFEDDALRREMMVNNAQYYQHHLRPDMLILNTLLTVLGGCTR